MTKDCSAAAECFVVRVRRDDEDVHLPYVRGRIAGSFARTSEGQAESWRSREES
jgi:hypothetical protein